jgi:hypothetical protein
MVCDAIIGIQHALLWAVPLSFILMTVVLPLEAVAAGSLWRRYRRPWPVTLAYVERVVPLAPTLGFGASAAWAAAVARSIIGADWLGVYERVFWPRQVALVLLIVAQVAVWRGWPVWLRLLLHAGWFVIVAFALHLQ